MSYITPLKGQNSDITIVSINNKKTMHTVATTEDSLNRAIVTDISIFPKEYSRRYNYTTMINTAIYDDKQNIVATIPKGIALRQTWIDKNKKKS
jgi:hypothetical protein